MSVVVAVRVTVVFTEAELLPGVGSLRTLPPASRAMAEAWLMIAAAMFNTTVMLAAAPEAMLPSWQLAEVPEALQVPWLGVVETKVAPKAGSVSVTFTCGAVCPLF